MADDGPAIKIGQIEDAEFTVNRYTIEDGEVVEQEVKANINDDDISDFEDEIDAELDDAVAEYEQTGEVPTEGTTEMDEQQAVEDVLPTARSVVQSNGITKSNWPTFAKMMREEGVTDQSLLSDVWAELREQEALVVESEAEDDPQDADEQESDDDGDSADESDDSDDGADPDENAPPANVSEMSMGEVFEDADAAFLAVSPGDEESDAAIDQFDSMIRSGDVETLNVDTSVNAADILSDADVSADAVPAVILRYGESHYALDELTAEGEPTDADDPQPTEEEESSDEPQSGSVEGGEISVENAPDIPVGMDILVLRSGAEASDLVQGALIEEITAEEVLAAPVSSDLGAFLVEPLPSGATLPLYIEATENGLEQRELEQLLAKYDVAV